MGGKPLGTRFPVYETATEMIRVSDNSATNLLIQRLGGMPSLNRRFTALGLTATVLNNWLPDLKGTNTTSEGIGATGLRTGADRRGIGVTGRRGGTDGNGVDTRSVGGVAQCGLRGVGQGAFTDGCGAGAEGVGGVAQCG